MKSFISIFTIAIACFFGQHAQPVLPQNAFVHANYQALIDSCESTTTTVYICTGPKSECYHSHSKCRGLNNCSTTIKTVSIEKAEEMKRRPCKLCYKQ